MNPFLLVTPFRNAERYVAKCAANSLNQLYDNYRVVFVDDASTDDSVARLQKAITGHGNTRCRQVEVESHRVQRGPLHRLHSAILKYGRPNDIVVTVDGDDWLLHNDVLTVVNAFYERHACWMTYGGALWNPSDRQTYETAPYTENEIAELRTPWHEGPHTVVAKWKVHHLRTFRCDLYHKLGWLDPTWSCLKDDEGRFYNMAGDVAMMLPLLEMAGPSRIGHIRSRLYVYNLHDHNEHMLNRPKQLGIMREIYAKPGFPRTAVLARQAPEEKVAPLFLRPPRATVGLDTHVSGWPFARRCLQTVRTSRPIVLDDFVEQTFCYGQMPPSHQRPWIGIFHHPPNIPDFTFPAHQLPALFESADWKRNAHALIGGIALSNHLASYLRNALDIPIEVVKHPSPPTKTRWSESAYRSETQHTLLQVGFYLRNTRAIYQVPPIAGYRKERLLAKQPWVVDYESRVRRYWGQNATRREFYDVQEPGFVAASDYEQRLKHSVVLTEVFDASANNVVIECIMRETPIAINRHPAVAEYLGSEYPLYFDDLNDIPDLLTTSRVVSAHHYLSRLDKRAFGGELFRRSIEESLEKLMNHTDGG